MEKTIQSEHFQDLVRNAVIFPLARRIITENYMDAAPGYESEMKALMGAVFAELERSASLDRPGFETVVDALPKRQFHQDDPEFWFNRVYREYKRSVKPVRRFENLQRWMTGKRLLDFGSGDGRLSVVFHQHGYQVYLADVLDYRDALAKDLPFVQMTETGHIPYPDQVADTAVVMAVLHHVELVDLSPLLYELKRVAKRVIVEEDTYAIPVDFPGLNDVLERDPYLREFLGLTPQDQFRYQMFIDYFANAITQGLPEMDFPYNFRSVPEWMDTFRAHGFRVSDVAVMGFQKRFFNRSCHVWFALDGNE